jgi:inorganic pyrophosphatase
LLISTEPLLPLTIARARVIGGFIQTTSDEEQPEQRLVAVAVDDPDVAELHRIGDLDPELKQKIEAFVRTYKQNQGVKVTFDGWFDREIALDQLRRDFKKAKKRAAR